MRRGRTLDKYMMALLIAIAVVGAVWGFSMPSRESDVMKVCELSHSHDVCFQALNR